MAIYHVQTKAVYDGKERTVQWLARSDQTLADIEDGKDGHTLISSEELKVGEHYSCDSCQELVTYPHKCTPLGYHEFDV